MKVTLKASNEAHRQIIMLWVGQKVEGIYKIYGATECGFVVDVYQTGFKSMSEITISLDTPMDLRLALGTNIEFENIHGTKGLIIECIRNYEEVLCYSVGCYGHFVTKDIKLSTNYLEQVGAKVEEV